MVALVICGGDGVGIAFCLLFLRDLIRQLQDERFAVSFTLFILTDAVSRFLNSFLLFFQYDLLDKTEIGIKLWQL